MAQYESTNQVSSWRSDEWIMIVWLLCILGTGRGRAFDDDIPADLLNNIVPDFEDDLYEDDLDDMQLRTNFPETWVYEDRVAGWAKL